MRTREKQSALVAGGAGFIGSNLCEKLLKRGDHVDCIDNLSTGSTQQIGLLHQYSNFKFIKGDIVDSDLVAQLSQHKYSRIYDLACPTGVPNISKLGEEMLLASSTGTRNLIRLAERCQARFLFASTAEAYGDPQIVPQSEAYFGHVDPVGPRSPYEEGKRFGEALTAYYTRARNLDARIVRIFNCYGPNMSERDQRVVPQMLNCMVRGERVVIYGDGRQIRTFCHVEDLLNGLERVMERGAVGDVYNIGSERELSVLELFEIAATIAGTGTRPIFKHHFITDHQRRCPDITKVKALGWEQRISVEEGLEQCYRALLAKTMLYRPRAQRPAAVHDAGRAEHPLQLIG